MREMEYVKTPWKIQSVGLQLKQDYNFKYQKHIIINKSKLQINPMNRKRGHKINLLHSRKNVLQDGGTKTNFVKVIKFEEVEHED